MVVIPAPEFPPGRRSALLIGIGRHEAPAGLPALRAPIHDVKALGSVLSDPQVGGFGTTQHFNINVQEMRVALEGFLLRCRPGELAVVYISCHGFLSRRGDLYFAATDTDLDLPSSTGLESRWLQERLHDCAARARVVILDCCYSGAFTGSKSTVRSQVEERLHGLSGRGLYVLTASRSSEYAFEAEPSTSCDDNAGSVFTTALVEGLRTGAADTDRDGFVSVVEAHAYVEAKLRELGSDQKPQLNLTNGEGSIPLTRHPTGIELRPTQLPEDIRMNLQSRYPKLRSASLQLVEELLTHEDLGLVYTAYNTLRRSAATDIPIVKQTADDALRLFDRLASEAQDERRKAAFAAIRSSNADERLASPAFTPSATGANGSTALRRSVRESELLTAAREVESWRGQPSATRISRELGISMPLATSLANALRAEKGLPPIDEAPAIDAPSSPFLRSVRGSELLTAAREVERWRGQPSATRISRELGISMQLATSLANALREQGGLGTL